MPSPEQIQVAALADEPGWAVLRERVKKARDDYFGALARTLYATPDKVTAADLHYKRGYFNGMAFLLNNPLFEQKALERELAREAVES